MSDQSLQALLERIRSDEDFSSRLKSEPAAALADFELSTVELFALTCGDEDALRRLVGASADFRDFGSSGYRDAVMAAFDTEVAAEVQQDASAGGKTSSVTSQTVTVCCW